jgi:hypothetical protein
MIEKCKQCGAKVELEEGDRIKICAGMNYHITLKQYEEKQSKKEKLE